MARDEPLTVVDAESVRIRFQCESVASQVSRDRVAIGLQGHTELPGSADLRHGGDIEGMRGQRAELQALLMPQIGRLLAGFAMEADIGNVEAVIGAGGRSRAAACRGR